jgi:glutamine amidotransferase
MVCIIDYKLGNVGSLVNMFKHINQKVVVSSEESVIKNAEFLILPGVGTFDMGVTNLHSTGLFEILTNEVKIKKKPILGICLGAQLMLNYSEEGVSKGLGWIDGNVKKFDTNNGVLKTPHMGWNDIIDYKENEVLFRNMPDKSPRFYFAHSYYFNLMNQNQIGSYTTYGNKFQSSFISENIYGVQFHPEKSHLFGMQLLKNFTSNK